MSDNAMALGLLCFVILGVGVTLSYLHRVGALYGVLHPFKTRRPPEDDIDDEDEDDSEDQP